MPDDNKVITASTHRENVRLWCLKSLSLLNPNYKGDRKTLKLEVADLEQLIERYQIQNEH
jgi:hypothetical protein